MEYGTTRLVVVFEALSSQVLALEFLLAPYQSSRAAEDPPGWADVEGGALSKGWVTQELPGPQKYGLLGERSKRADSRKGMQPLNTAYRTIRYST